jgi:hypothetical protein
MPDDQAITEIDRRIALVRENIRTLIEQAAAYSGAADEERAADRIAEQQSLLDELEREKAQLAK